MEDRTTAKNLAAKLHFEKLSEEQKLQLARELLELDADIARAVYDQLEDSGAGKLELFERYCQAGDLSQALSLAAARLVILILPPQCASIELSMPNGFGENWMRHRPSEEAAAA